MNKQIKVVIIGAGSAIFTKTILSDLLAFQDVPIREVALVDINTEKLRVIHEMTELMAKQVGRTLKVSSSSAWRDVLEGADFVINTIGVGGPHIYQRDLEIADKYGVCESVGDIIGPTGIFRMPPDIACHFAIWLNTSSPARPRKSQYISSVTLRPPHMP